MDGINYPTIKSPDVVVNQTPPEKAHAHQMSVYAKHTLTHSSPALLSKKQTKQIGNFCKLAIFIWFCFVPLLANTKKETDKQNRLEILGQFLAIFGNFWPIFDNFLAIFGSFWRLAFFVLLCSTNEFSNF